MAENENQAPAAEATAPEGVQLQVQTIYAKDISVESPNAPEIFLEQYQPEIGVNMATQAKNLENDAYEAELKVTVTSKVGEKTAYIVEVVYGGVFSIKGLSDEDRTRLLRTFCMEQLFPYVREAISEQVARAGFPRFVLQPMNFNAMYEQGLRQAAEQTQANA